MQIRRARPEDFPGLADLMERVYTPFLLGTDEPYLQQLRDVERRDREAQVWAAVADDGLLGCVTHCPPGSAWHEVGEADEGEFRMLAVDAAARGRGVGEALVVHCEDLARDEGARSMKLSSLPTMIDAHRLYSRRGYVRLADQDWEPEPGVLLWVFAKRL